MADAMLDAIVDGTSAWVRIDGAPIKIRLDRVAPRNGILDEHLRTSLVALLRRVPLRVELTRLDVDGVQLAEIYCTGERGEVNVSDRLVEVEMASRDT